jgi:hypothetical protein
MTDTTTRFRGWVDTKKRSNNVVSSDCQKVLVRFARREPGSKTGFEGAAEKGAETETKG